MAGQVTGYGNIAKANVFKLSFSENLSSDPVWEAYDNGQAFPLVDASGSTTAGKLFIGTTGNSNKPMIGLVATTGGAPSSSWLPASATAGSANPNRLYGTTSYVTDSDYDTSSDYITWNMCVEIPYDMEPSDDMDHLLQCKYTYTGSAPSLTWAYNTGTEGAPIWTTMTPDTDGIRHCAAGASAPNYYANIPYSGVEVTTVGWVTT